MPSTSAPSLTAQFQRFKKAVEKSAKKLTEDQIVLFQKKLCFLLEKGFVKKTPVDQGRAINNWQIEIGENNGRVLGVATDKTGQSTIARETAKLAALKPFDTVVIFNNLPYIVPLEHGHSREKAPAGMVGVTLNEVSLQYG